MHFIFSDSAADKGNSYFGKNQMISLLTCAFIHNLRISEPDYISYCTSWFDVLHHVIMIRIILCAFKSNWEVIPVFLSKISNSSFLYVVVDMWV